MNETLLIQLVAFLIVINLTISIAIQIMNTLVLRELFRYLRSTGKTEQEQLHYILGKIDQVELHQTANCKRTNELLGTMTQVVCPTADNVRQKTRDGQ